GPTRAPQATRRCARNCVYEPRRDRNDALRMLVGRWAWAAPCPERAEPSRSPRGSAQPRGTAEPRSAAEPKALRRPGLAPFTSRTAPVQRSRECLNYGCRMSQPPRSPSPLTARLYDLEYPRSLGVYNTYQEVQSVVDTLADEQFPVQSTLIVGTDLKLMERVTGRRTWPRVTSQGALSGLWMGLFLGLLLLLLSPGNLTVVLTSVLLGIIFFTVSSVIGYWMTGGQRDFTSMTATIPMQYELLVEHKHAAQAQRILAESGAAPAPMPAQPRAPYRDAPHSGGHQYGAPAPQPGAPSPSTPSPSRPSYGQPAPTGPVQDRGPARSGRPSFGM